MKHIFILYNPGYAGNFLARLFSLDHSVIPQLPESMLRDCVRSGQYPDINDRAEFYSFDSVKTNYKNWQDFHRDWTTFNTNNSADFYRWLHDLTIGKDSVSAIIYAIHPHEFNKSLRDIHQIKNKDFYYVSLNLEKYQLWINQAQEKLGFVYRDNELQLGSMLPTAFNMKEISLTRMLDSESEFLDEYQRVCELMGIPAEKEKALTLYQGWRKTRVDQ